MTLLYIGALLFGGSHLFSILFHGLRDSFRAQMGPKAWRALYGAVSLLGLVLIGSLAYARGRLPWSDSMRCVVVYLTHVGAITVSQWQMFSN